MTIREFISNDTIFNLDEIRIEHVDSVRNYTFLFQGSWYLNDGLKYLDCTIVYVIHDFEYNYTVFVI